MLKLTIKQKIYLLLVGGVFYTVLLFGAKYASGQVTIKAFEKMKNTEMELILIVQEIKSSLSKMQNVFVANLTSKVYDGVGEAQDLNSFSQASENALKKLEAFAQNQKNDQLVALSKKLDIRYAAFNSNALELESQDLANDPEEAIFAVNALNAIADKMNAELDGIIDYSKTSLHQGIENFAKGISKRLKILALISAASLAIFIIVGLLFSRDILGRIRVLLKGTQEFSAKNFDYKINDTAHDELGTLGKSFNEMSVSIKELLDEQQRVNEILDQKVQEKTEALNKNILNLEKANQLIVDSIHYASKIQHAFLPKSDKLKNLLNDHFVIWNQRDIVGGDFYWVEEVKDGFLVAVIDCTGHGVPGSLMTMVAVSALDRIVKEKSHTNPAEILQKLHEIIAGLLHNSSGSDLSDDGMEVGICHIDKNETTLTYAGARMPLFYVHGEETYEIKGDKYGIGYKNTPSDYQFTTHEIEIKKGSSFYIVTDGITEQVGGTQKRMVYGKKRLKELLKRIHKKDKPVQRRLLLETIDTYRGIEPQRDDMTCVGFRFVA